jgi:predicted ribosomally synthesized peptide with SipW-like signal peptide
MSLRNVLKNRVSLREFAPAVALVLNSLVWFALLTPALGTLVDNMGLATTENIVLHGIYYAGIAAAAIVGAFVFPRRRETYLLSWMLFGCIVTALPLLVNSEQLFLNALVLILAGISVGLGLPSTLAYFADTTAVENRGTYGGITWSTVGFGILAFAVALTAFNLPNTLLALAVWRAVGLLVFFLLVRIRGKLQPSQSKPRYGAILRRRDVMLYLLPWIMFSLINFTEAPILGKVFGESQQIIGVVEFAITGIFATVGGIMGDLVGRKRVVITGFVILGIEYAVLSLFAGFTASWYVYTVFDGIAWGMFASVFFMTLWGDLAETHQKEKFYVLGGLPYLLAGFLPVVVKPFLATIETTTAFSLASFFLFVAVLPLMYAPETLPEKKIKERELRDYVDRAKKTKEKYT